MKMKIYFRNLPDNHHDDLVNRHKRPYMKEYNLTFTCVIAFKLGFNQN